MLFASIGTRRSGAAVLLRRGITTLDSASSLRTLLGVADRVASLKGVDFMSIDQLRCVSAQQVDSGFFVRF